jgi:release factor glutamine methyltransferase
LEAFGWSWSGEIETPVRIFTLPGVFQPRSDSWMLVAAVRRATLDPRASALDLCTGSGAVAVATALRGVRSVTAVDMHRRSTWTGRLNARVNGVRIRALKGDLFEPVAGRRFDLITANPPYLPVPPDLAPRRGDHAWNAGDNGRAVIDRIIEQLPDHLEPGGSVLLVQSSVTGTRETLDRLADVGLAPAIVERRRGPLGPLMAGRVDYLIREGLLRGPRLEEDVLVIGAQHARARAGLRFTRSDGYRAGLQAYS